MNTSNGPVSASHPTAAEWEICISCVKTNVPGTHFCRHCGTPLTSYAATAPFESLLAQGDFFRKAVRAGRWSRTIRIGVMVFLILQLLLFVLGLMLP